MEVTMQAEIDWCLCWALGSLTISTRHIKVSSCLLDICETLRDFGQIHSLYAGFNGDFGQIHSLYIGSSGQVGWDRDRISGNTQGRVKVFARLMERTDLAAT